jgi:hypothetical protein
MAVNAIDFGPAAHRRSPASRVGVGLAGGIVSSARRKFRHGYATANLALVAGWVCASRAPAQWSVPTVRRVEDNPIIRAEMFAGPDGDNIDGPSLIRTPKWLKGSLGRYYLYFAHHGGQYIRLAYANSVTGPYTVYQPGTLRIEQMPWCDLMVASPDVHVDDIRHEIRMYFHCHERSTNNMVTFVARSIDGLHFAPQREALAPGFARIFQWRGDYYALAMPGILYRSRDGLTGFVKGPTLFGDNMRHSAVTQNGANDLWVLYSNVGEEPPEHIVMTRIRLTGNWMGWKAEPARTLLKPQTTYEGINYPLRKSVRGGATQVRELRDPALYHEGKWYLLYSVAGESGIAIAQLVDWRP